MDLEETEWGGVDHIGLAQDRDSWRSPVNMERTLEFHKMLGNFVWLYNWWPFK
jgi:hypothetical protein